MYLPAPHPFIQHRRRVQSTPFAERSRSAMVQRTLILPPSFTLPFFRHLHRRNLPPHRVPPAPRLSYWYLRNRNLATSPFGNAICDKTSMALASNSYPRLTLIDTASSAHPGHLTYRRCSPPSHLVPYSVLYIGTDSPIALFVSSHPNLAHRHPHLPRRRSSISSHERRASPLPLPVLILLSCFGHLVPWAPIRVGCFGRSSDLALRALRVILILLGTLLTLCFGHWS
ncbi:hypothetical protein C8F01DRAFT_270554 [Mycena amicta]|nr:hypothetical protein C8F01DRAFT_270554 [Mycena amicta]